MKAAGVVVDDAAVTPRYVVGFAAARELPIIWRIALGSLKNKLLFLLPAALLLSLLAPWAITPLLMLGGAFLCYEGAEKLYEALWPHAAHVHEAKTGAAPEDPRAFEEARIASAIKTDFILSAEIMALTLATVPEASLWTQAAVLALVGLGITIAVYAAVALIVKADDAGVALVARARTGVVRGLGRLLVVGMPVFLKLLGMVGTVAMLWVGGGILLHGLEEYGITGPAHLLHDAAEATGHAVPALGGVVAWLVTAAGSAVVGLVVGAVLIPVVEHVVAPLARRVWPGGGAARHAA
jgi:predicted DNA repair protein MutK